MRDKVCACKWVWAQGVDEGCVGKETGLPAEVLESMQRFQYGEHSDTQLFWQGEWDRGRPPIPRSFYGIRAGHGCARQSLLSGREIVWTGLEAGRPEEEEGLAHRGKGTGTYAVPCVMIWASTPLGLPCEVSGCSGLKLPGTWLGAHWGGMAPPDLIHNSETHWDFEMNTVYRFIRGIWDQENTLEIDATESGIIPRSQAGGLVGLLLIP